MTINSDKPMESFEGRRSSQEVLDQVEGNKTIKLNRPIGSLKGRRQLAWYEQSERPNSEGSRNMTLGEL